MMKLYSYFQSSASYRVRIALGLKGLGAEMHYVNLVKGEHLSENYDALNPAKIVPTFMDMGHTMSQSLAIMEYLEEAYPTPSIMPEDMFARAHIRALCQTIAADTAPLGNLKVRKYLSGTLKVKEEKINQWMKDWIHDGLAAYEKMLEQCAYAGRFSCSNMPTMADCCLIPQVFNANRWKCDLSTFPRIRAIAEYCETHPAFIAAHPSKQADAA